MLTASIAATILFTIFLSSLAEAFTSPIIPHTNYGLLVRHPSTTTTISTRTRIIAPPKPTHQSSSSSSTSLNFGSDGGILGVGAPEVAVTLLVGYFVLGPSDLYKLVKEIGKLIQNFRTLGAEAAKTFEGTMDDQLDLKELRKAQSELNEAFSFRRSINTDEGMGAFEMENSFSENTATAAATTTAAAVASDNVATASDGSTVAIEEGVQVKKKRRLVRRKKKKVVEEDEEGEELSEEFNVPSEEDKYPDLDMLDVPNLTEEERYPDLDMLDVPNLTEEERLRAERLERLSGSSDDEISSEPDWFNASKEDIASEVLSQNGEQQQEDAAMSSYAKQRFQSQLSAEDWNKQIMEKEDELGPCKLSSYNVCYLNSHLKCFNTHSQTHTRNMQIMQTCSIHGNATISHPRRREECSR